MHPTRRRLVTAMSRLEALRQRNDTQRRQLLKQLTAMTDHATGAARAVHDAAAAGDPAAIQTARKALAGRTAGRRALAASADDSP